LKREEQRAESREQRAEGKEEMKRAKRVCIKK